MLGQLEVIDGPDKGKVFPFEQGQIVAIGRGPSATTRLTDRYVSRLHCQIEVQQGSVILTDLGGAGGTHVNGATVSKQPLMAGDVIAIGQTSLRVDLTGVLEDQTWMRPAAAAEAAAPALPDDASALTGRVLAHFEVGPVLGAGRMSVTFRARDTRSGTAVALKVHQPVFAEQETARQRFFRSANTLTALRHPNLVAVHDSGQTGPFCWLAMELVEGESLERIIQRIGVANILDWRHALRVAVHVARALAFAQQHSIIHRNISPANILVRSSDRCTKLADLLLTKVFESVSADRITTPGELLGEIPYMSPERACGGVIDGRSDIYSLGATVYALLTGRPPFRAKAYAELVQALRDLTPSCPKTVQLSIPDDFDAVVMRMLAKKPEDRFATAQELLTALEEVARAKGVAMV